MELNGALWRKSSRSNGHGGNCVEVAGNLPEVVGVRDSKDPTGPVLAFTAPAWRSFLRTLRSR
ncbi:DUF397 domain-containing protein [Micromonospora sp. WMMD1102]|uniref:DUF397 domain-containing protein n=1 Tax=Micromonospora sp. WMMD1102 TaxID=3016105 RepID=UPI002414E5C9|nr:DUF397 domain-containing protein [Micromonospora sp. WMMD1102]MDG4785628.1 DUF397 domain-containing protein [Micromonospora sp. WMMD1102]